MKTLLFALALLASGLGIAADAPTVSPLDRLAVFSGTWKSNSETYKTPYSEEGSVSATLVNQCWKTGAYFICNQSMDGASRVLLVYTYRDGDTYTVTISGSRIEDNDANEGGGAVF